MLTVRNERNGRRTVVKYARHDFESSSRDYGFRELMKLADLQEDGGGPNRKSGFIGPDGALTLQCKVWGVTDGMRAAERALKLTGRARAGGGFFGGGSTHGSASSATSTSMGSTGSEDRLRRSLASLRRPFASLGRSIGRLFTRPSRRRRELYIDGVEPSGLRQGPSGEEDAS